MAEIIEFMTSYPIVSGLVILIACANVFMIALLVSTKKQRFYARHGLTPVAGNAKRRYHPQNRRVVHGH